MKITTQKKKTSQQINRQYYAMNKESRSIVCARKREKKHRDY